MGSERGLEVGLDAGRGDHTRPGHCISDSD